jgi:hypothetical protein
MTRLTKHRRPPKATKAELAYIRDMEKRSVFDMLETGEARILTPEEYPEPIKRLRAKQRHMLYLALRPSVFRKLEARSRRDGVPVE